LRIKKRDAEIERANAVSADSNNLPVLSAVDDGDFGGDGGDGGADYDGDDCDDDRYVRISPECCNVLGEHVICCLGDV